MKILKQSFYLLLACGLFLSTGCKDDEPDALTILSIIASGDDLSTGGAIDVDLNGSTAATNVPLEPSIAVTFSRDVDASSATTNTIMLSQGSTDVPIRVSVAGSVVTITTTNPLARGLSYTLDLDSDIQAADGGNFAGASRTFTAAGRADVVPPQSANQMAYWNFNGNANSSVGNFNGTATAVTFGEDRFGDQESAAFFDGDASIIEVANSDQLLTDNFTLSFWMWIDSTNHINANGNGKAGHFVMGLGNTHGFFIEVFGNIDGMKFTGQYTKEDGSLTTNDFFFNGDGKDATNGGWVGVEFERDLMPTGGLGGIIDRKWTHVVITYDASANKRSLYLNGLLMETDNLNNAPALATVNGLKFDATASADVIGNGLAFGFLHDLQTTKWSDTPWGGYNEPGANHFKGGLDDVRIFDTAFSDSDVMTLYNAEKP